MENLPREILSDIFIRLLAKQLAQMRCVSKSWNALLSESSFVKSHLHRSIHNNDGILLFFPCEDSFKRNCFKRSPLIARRSQSPDIELTNFIKLPVNPCSRYTCASVIGSVNGLICFRYGSYPDYFVHIWNPSLSAMLTLPPYHCPDRDNEVFDMHLRYGYDPRTDDYKVVKFTSLFRSSGMVPEVEVYSMRNGYWELITSKFPEHIAMLCDQDEVCEDGHLHLIGHIDGDLNLQTIVAFDLGAETFREIPLPDSIQSQRYYLDIFRTFGGKLCVVSRCELWLMDEYGVVESWVKIHAFSSRYSCNITPYGFTLRNNFINRVDDEQFVLYDPIDNKAKTFRITCCCRYVGLWSMLIVLFG